MISRFAREVQPFIVMDIMEMAEQLERQGKDIIHLEVGEPDFDTPPPMRQAMVQALTSGHTHYTHSLGIWDLRLEVARYYERHYGVALDPCRVIVTTGTSAAFLLVLSALLDPGGRIVLSDPGYPCYKSFAALIGAEVLAIPVGGETGFAISPELLEHYLEDRGEVVLISSPSNPMGSITPRETYEWLAGRGVTCISDEIYHDLVYTDAPQFTGLEISQEIVVINGFSKRWAMTGLRLGWMVVPPALLRPINKIAQNLYICPPTPCQYAGLAALRQGDEYVRQMRQEYDRRRKTLLAGLKELGFLIHSEPQGAFYIFADITPFARDSYDFALKMLEQAGVAVTPGKDFGKNQTSRFVRFAYTNSLERIEAAIGRLQGWLGR